QKCLNFRTKRGNDGRNRMLGRVACNRLLKQFLLSSALVHRAKAPVLMRRRKDGTARDAGLHRAGVNETPPIGPFSSNPAKFSRWNAACLSWANRNKLVMREFVLQFPMGVRI